MKRRYVLATVLVLALLAWSVVLPNVSVIAGSFARGLDAWRAFAASPADREALRSTLIISVASGEDTTLVINGPDGQWYCDDDTNGVNPMVRFESPGSGQYDIYVGHYGQNRGVPARLYISELTSPDAG